MKAPQIVSFVQPLITRGEEIKSVDTIVAYYCFYSAVRQVLEGKLHTQDPEVAEFATSLLNEIESMKNDNLNREVLEDDDASRAHVLNFASTVFSKADRATQNHNVTRATGAGFAAAAVFLGLESVWGELDPETVEKIKYSKYQATRILKAIKNGEDPNDLYKPEESEIPEKETEEKTEYDQIESNGNITTPKTRETIQDEEAGADLPEPPRAKPEEDLQLPHAPKENINNDIKLPPPPAATPEGNLSPTSSSQSIKNSEVEGNRQNDNANIPPKPAVNAKSEKSTSNNVGSSQKVNPAEIIKLTSTTGSAQKHAKYAMSALNYDDIDTAITQLEQALNILKVYKQGC